ncbi:hypothetical protein KVR01_011949 [Diaporthe batatas]|uniref:uncharacterized protein n=1 Tax=Diaporthe batatas TaxID=748121 RepID=UPI001D055A4D|nr:uncharacterized protein KVR01_011949 [Diaporthe batatas]KAG8158188.1 hypothetical protein KVR01_011949 [Diaporthe batatas]
MPVCSDIQERLGRHEQWLIGLRRDPDMTLAKIRGRLDTDKGLKATASQLETFFRISGQRKNLSRHEWISVFRALDSQNAIGNRFDVYISGKLLSEEELRKKRKNAKPPLPLAEDPVVADRLIKHLPNGVTVQKLAPRGSPMRSPERSMTPRLIAQELFDLNQDLGAASGSMLGSIASHSGLLPVQDVILHERGMGSHSLGPVVGSPSDRNQPQLLNFASNVEKFSILHTSYGSLDFEVDGWNSFPNPNSPGAWERLIGPLSPGPFPPGLLSPGTASQNDFWVPGLNYTSPTTITPTHRPDDLSPIESARLLLGGPGSGNPRRALYASDALKPTAEELVDKLKSLVLADADSVFCRQYDVVDGTRVFTDQFIELLLFSVANNFAGIDQTPVDLIIKFINDHEPARRSVLRHLRTGASTVYARALAETLLKAAITAGDARTVHDLLALKIVRPDDIIFVDHDRDEDVRRMAATERAAVLRQLEILELLLRFGADVNKTCKPAWYQRERGALECAIGIWDDYRRPEIRLVDLLLDNGATVRARLLDAAVRWGDTTLVDKLVSKISPADHAYFFRQYTIIAAAHYLKNDSGYRFVRQMMQTCQGMHDSACFNSEGDRLAHAMGQAARRNNRDLVDLLLPHVDQKGRDWALTAAARFGSRSLVQFLLEHGACVNGQPYRLDSDTYQTTPLAEAIRKSDDELIEIFVREGAWKEIDQPDRLRAILSAVVDSGSSAYLDQVLGLVRAPGSAALDQALFCAIKACHQEIALKLLEAGANPVASDNGREKSLLEALRIKSHSITWAMLESDMAVEDLMDEEVLEAAISWGDLKIIRALFCAGNGVNTYWGRPPLSFAIKAGNRSLIDFMISLGADLNINPAKKPSLRPSPGRQGFYKVSDGRPVFVTDGSERFSSPLAAAALVRDDAILSYLLDHGADPADEQAILNAVIHDRSLLSLILESFRQRYPRGRTGFGGKVLLHALKTRDEAALDLLLGVGFDVNHVVDDHETYIMVSALGFAVKHYQNRLATISKLLDSGGDPNSTTSMTGMGDDRIGPILLAGEFQSVSMRITTRQTALLDAIETESLPLVELLVSRGADIHKEAKLGLRRTPLQKACEVGSHSIVDFLLGHKVDVNAAPAARHGATALQLAAKTGSLRMAKKLLDLGAKVDAPGVRAGGRSAIEYAAEYGRLDMILLLFNAGGGEFVPDQCTSAIALAEETGHWACAGLLVNLSTRNQAFLDANRH